MTAPSSNWGLKKTEKSNFLPLILVIGIVLVIEGGLQCYRSLQINQLNIDISKLQNRLTVLENEKNLHRVVKRQASNNLYEDDVPIRQGRYKDQSQEQTSQGDSEGMRVYDAWFQHKNARHIPKSRVGGANRRKASDYGNAIKPYHRTSASWVSKKRKSGHDLNAHFDQKIYRNAYPNRRNSGSSGSTNRRSGGGSAIDIAAQPHTNFFKITPTEEPPLETSDEFTTPVTQRNVISQLPIQRPIANNNATRSNRNLVRSGSTRRRKTHKNRDSSSALNQFQGLKAVHYVGEVGGRTPHNAGVYEGEGNQVNQDGIFRQWAPARWAIRMRATEDFPLDHEGRLSVKKSGLYYIYAQVNYLDEHDVNAFQVYVNEDPYLLCTVMTHTRHSTTKANTCFTSGVTFLEAEDQILIRDLEPMRNSVIRPAHTFFGLVQLSTY